MIFDREKQIADAVLYEGYILYPYRASAVKNRQRWTFGGVFPLDVDDEISTMKTEILLRADAAARVEILVRFLQTQERQVRKLRIHASEGAVYERVAELDVEGQRYVTWDEAVEREITASDILLSEVLSRPRRMTFGAPAQEAVETIYAPSGAVVGTVTRTCQALEGLLEISATELDDGVLRLGVAVTNTTKLPESGRLSRADAQTYAFMSTHMLMHTPSGEFISILDPPAHLQSAAETCRNQGTWPVLVGEEGKRDKILSSPIILYDYPKVAPESKGPFFDGAEIDEMLALRVLTLTDDEKREMTAADPRTKAMLERCEAMNGLDFASLHGALRPAEASPAEARPFDLAIGHHVRLNPKPRGDVFDLALKGKVATILAIERDFDDRVHVAVTLMDDPGGDLGAAGFPGHRFYFSREEIEPVNSGDRP
jgi:hydrogenase maturation protease